MWKIYIPTSTNTAEEEHNTHTETQSSGIILFVLPVIQKYISKL